MIELANASKKLGSFLLKDISLYLPDGYIMGLIGQNGAGKTTLLHLILGLYQPDGGTVQIDGKNYGEKESEIRQMTGTVLPDEFFDAERSLIGNADYYGKNFAHYEPQAMKDTLERFALRADRKYHALSVGEKLKFQFAFALSHAPKLLVLDEPAGNFDPEFRALFYDVLKEFIADGTRSVILSTHLTGELERIADYISYLEEGSMLFSGDVETLRESFRLVCGEKYKIALLPADRVVSVESGEYGTKALVRHRERYAYDRELTVYTPSLEEWMCFMAKRRR